MSDLPSPGPRVTIPRLSISGVDAATARSLGPSIEQALAEAAQSGRLQGGHRHHLRLKLQPGANARAIARALTRALEGG